ncbi:predicted protein [Coccidioides posadasii str. Silveira]|uniref:Predicted protein n=2 Tax=Coccidioides posadasii TaxID=199306 RepID=E9DDG3_COCPS|nr:predicted protein [Coccidioides posadasii str. Silveira]KMM65621.1 hypothetical protein CPAG_01967 [Coccidioides posadasii RMSCC 3488]
MAGQTLRIDNAEVDKGYHGVAHQPNESHERAALTNQIPRDFDGDVAGFRCLTHALLLHPLIPTVMERANDGSGQQPNHMRSAEGGPDSFTALALSWAVTTSDVLRG